MIIFICVPGYDARVFDEESDPKILIIAARIIPSYNNVIKGSRQSSNDFSRSIDTWHLKNFAPSANRGSNECFSL
jgi:hypothetical protein